VLLNLARNRSPLRINGHDTIKLAVLLSFPVTGLDQFLHTPLAWISADPMLQAQHWITNSLMLVPLFAIGAWAGEWIADRIADRTGSVTIVRRALVISLCAGVALAPVWFERNKSDDLASTQALTTPRSQGSIDVYSVSPKVIVALSSVCLVAIAIWAGSTLGDRIAGDRTASETESETGSESGSETRSRLARASVLALLVCTAPVLAWLLQRVSQQAYASQVDYTRALLSVPARSHALLAGHAGLAGHVSHAGLAGHAGVPRMPVTAAPFSSVYSVAHAFQDGLADQAAGLPVAAMTLLYLRRGTLQHAMYLKEVPR
jgi:MFS family permease